MYRGGKNQPSQLLQHFYYQSYKVDFLNQNASNKVFFIVAKDLKDCAIGRTY